MFHGAITALITPFKEGKVDDKAYQDLVKWQIEQGIHGLVPCGTTGESPTLSHEEHNHVTSLCVQAAEGKVPVIAGTGSNCTDEAIMMSQHAEEVGANAVLIATPYYNKPTQEGLYQHFKAVHDAIGIPIILYNIPGRSVVDMSDETTARLAELPRIVGIKDATGDLARIATLRMHLGDDFCYLSGEDATALAFNAQGGHGCISVTANIMPKQCAELHTAWQEGDWKRAFMMHENLMPVHQAMFCETSPVPVKYAASLMGLCSSELRLPMVEPSETNKAFIKSTLNTIGLI